MATFVSEWDPSAADYFKTDFKITKFFFKSAIRHAAKAAGLTNPEATEHLDMVCQHFLGSTKNHGKRLGRAMNAAWSLLTAEQSNKKFITIGDLDDKILFAFTHPVWDS